MYETRKGTKLREPILLFFLFLNYHILYLNFFFFFLGGGGGVLGEDTYVSFFVRAGGWEGSACILCTSVLSSETPPL